MRNKWEPLQIEVQPFEIAQKIYKELLETLGSIIYCNFASSEKSKSIESTDPKDQVLNPYDSCRSERKRIDEQSA